MKYTETRAQIQNLHMSERSQNPPLCQEMGLKVGHEASFAVQLNGARGLIDAKIHTPSGASEECFITELDSGN